MFVNRNIPRGDTFSPLQMLRPWFSHKRTSRGRRSRPGQRLLRVESLESRELLTAYFVATNGSPDNAGQIQQTRFSIRLLIVAMPDSSHGAIHDGRATIVTPPVVAVFPPLALNPCIALSPHSRGCHAKVVPPPRGNYPGMIGRGADSASVTTPPCF